MNRLLIIDDFFGREVPRGRNLERESLCRRLGLVEFGAKAKPSAAGPEALGMVCFFRGQTPEKATVGDTVTNDLEKCLRRIEAGAPDGEPWDLLMLDLCFYTGEVTEASDADFAGFPEGRPEDDDPDNFFGLEILTAVRSRFPELPAVVFSAHSGEKIQARVVQDLGAVRFIARDDSQARTALGEVLADLNARDFAASPVRDAREILEIARNLHPPTTAELQRFLPVLKELEAVLLLRALRGALARNRQEREGVSLLPAIKLITGNADLTTSQAADLVKRLVHQTRPYDAMLLADDLIREAYEKSVRLRPGAGNTRRHDDD